MFCLHKVFVYGTLMYFVVFVRTEANDSYPDYPDDYDDYGDYREMNNTQNNTLEFIQKLKNITKPGGKVVKLTCEVKNNAVNSTNPMVHFSWKKNNAYMRNETKISIRNNYTKAHLKIYSSQLRITRLDKLDSGFYLCLASYNSHKLYSEGFLEVIDKWGSAPSEIPSQKTPIFDSSQMHNIDGSTTFFPSTEKKLKSKEFFTSLSGSVIPTLGEDMPKGTSFVFEKGLEDLHQENYDTIFNISQPFCQLYTGNTCKNYLSGKYVFVQPQYSQEIIENRLEKAVLVVSQSNEISSSCNKFALPSLCFSAFPICLDDKKTNMLQKDYITRYQIEKDVSIFKNVRNKLHLQRICKLDCELLEKELCSREYAIAKRHPVISKTLELDECEYLPDEKSSTYCLQLGVEMSESEEDMCYWDYGSNYRGVQDVSITGKKCIKWSHQFIIAMSEYPELVGHSYCRNPGLNEAEPFCYVDQSSREICGVPKCGNIVSFYLLVAGVPFLIVIIIIFIIIYCRRKQNEKKNSLQNMNIPAADKNIYGNTGPNSPMELNTLLPTNRINNIPTRSHNSNKNGFQNIPNYTYKELTFVEELGEGAFGKVYKGDLRTKSGKVVVAVKSLKENASAKTQADFQREIELISELKHPNIICLLGVVIKQEPMCMLFEFMSEGDLHEFLIANSPSENKCLSQQQFLHIALQISQGMEYLSENHYVHRDLAARNCLVSKDLVVKISDFGLSRDMYSCDYYRVQSKSLLPVRWMPPESILYGKFTTESDVWSYGVVLWEIYSYGLQPYYGYNNQEVINMIRSRKLLPCPDSCPSYCYVLMVECWAELAMRRPSFSEIVHRLKMWQQNGSSPFVEASKMYNSSQSKHGSKSSHTSESISVPYENPHHHHHESQNTWEKNLRKSSVNKLTESQSSLNSHSSGNRTQSTSLSNDRSVNTRKGDRKSGNNQKGSRSEEGFNNAKHIVVNSNGDSFETKLSF